MINDNLEQKTGRAETDDILEDDNMRQAIALNEGSLRGGSIPEYDYSIEMSGVK